MLRSFSVLKAAGMLSSVVYATPMFKNCLPHNPHLKVKPYNSECFEKLMNKVTPTKPISPIANCTHNLVLTYLKFNLYQLLANDGESSKENRNPKDKNDKKEPNNLNSKLRFYENILGNGQNILYVQIENPDCDKPKSKKGPKPDLVLDVCGILGDVSKLSNVPRLFSVFVKGQNSESINISEVKIDGYRIFIPQDSWSADLTFIFCYNTEICKATYTKTTEKADKESGDEEKGEKNGEKNGNGEHEDSEKEGDDDEVDVYNAVFKSFIFKPNDQFVARDIELPGNEASLTFLDYSNPLACKESNSLCEIINKLRKARSCRKSISDKDLQFIKSSCNCKKLKDNIVKKCCKRKEKKCKIEVTFHRYISYVVTSIKTLCIYKAHSSKSYREECHQLFRKCARKCEDRFEGCNVVMHIMADRCYKLISQFSMAIESYFSMYVKYNPYLCVSYKQGTSIYGLSTHDRKCFGNLISTEGQTDTSSALETEAAETIEDEDVESVEEEMKEKKKPHKGFFSKYKWHITATVAVTVVVVAVYTFAF